MVVAPLLLQCHLRIKNECMAFLFSTVGPVQGFSPFFRDYYGHFQFWCEVIIFTVSCLPLCPVFDLSAGNVVCSWGRGEDGQLGHGDADDRFLPTRLSALDGLEIISVACGADHTTAFSLSPGEVYSWGWSASHLFNT